MIRYKEGFKYQLQESYSIVLPWFPDYLYKGNEWLSFAHKTLTIQRGYAWDGPSGPTLDTKDTLRASLVHDALYQLLRLGILDEKYRQNADEELRKIGIEDGMNSVRAWLWYYAVRLAAGSMAKKGTERTILEAP